MYIIEIKDISENNTGSIFIDLDKMKLATRNNKADITTIVFVDNKETVLKGTTGKLLYKMLSDCSQKKGSISESQETT